MTINGAKYEIISVTYTKSNKLKKRIKNAPENTLIFENTHEAIIDRKIFVTVQKHFEGRKRPDINGEMDKYPEAAFFNVGTIDEVVEKARQIEA